MQTRAHDEPHDDTQLRKRSLRNAVNALATGTTYVRPWRWARGLTDVVLRGRERRTDDGRLIKQNHVRVEEESFTWFGDQGKATAVPASIEPGVGASPGNRFSAVPRK
jgi:hypothetical protein